RRLPARRRGAALRASRASGRRGRSRAGSEELERFAIAVRTAAEDPLCGERRDHRDVPPLLLALLRIRQVHFDDLPGKELERVVDRVAVVTPGARVRDHRVGPVERVVAEADVLTLAVRLAAAHRVAELARPRFDALL